MNGNIDANVEYTLRPDGIHEFTIKEASVSAVDAYYAELEHIYQSRTDPREPLRLLMNTPKRSLPLDYMMQRGKALMAEYPNLGTICSVTISNNLVETRIADTFLRIMRFPGVRARFFTPSQRDDAIKWLLEQT